ncbi:MAG TPA: Ig-like domain repeat protein, partial [Solirubrobacteraceae bacterium]|nr:Ig-like domain repeat protein [Solirubrobacteraceae bacterium]
MRRTRFGVLAGVCLLFAIVCGSAAAAVPAWTTYRHDGARSGIDPDSTSPVAPAQVWQTPALDGSIYAQPLVYQSRVYAATENNTVYALDAASGAVVWQRHLATAVDASALPCGDISPTVGVTSTPVIDPTTGRIYAVADTWDGSNVSSIHHEMYALNLADGSLAGAPVRVDPPGAPVGDTPDTQLQRASLALDAGKVIIGYGGNAGDCGPYHGWLVAAPEAGGALQAFEVDRATSKGAIWASGNAPPVDSSGDIWTSTGNGVGGLDRQESVIRLDANLNLLDQWTPANWSTLDGTDQDIGSSMPVLLPNNLVFQIGKAGRGYLLNASHLGGLGGQRFSQSVCSGSWGGGIYRSGVIYASCADGLRALSLNPAAPSFTPLAGWAVNSDANGPPIFAGGLVWAVGWNGATLYGLDPATGATRFSANLNGFEHFTTPSAAGGRLFVANNDASAASDDITAFQIATPPPPSATATALGSSADPAGPGQAVTLTATVSPTPDAGTVAFTDGGAPIAGCGAVAVSVASGQAVCNAAFSASGNHAIEAAYSGDPYYLSSRAGLTEAVTGSAAGGPPGSQAGASLPAISHLHVSVAHRKLRLRLNLSESAKLTVVVAKLVPGRLAHHRCRAGRRRGRRCQAAVHQLTLHLSGRKGRNKFAPRMRALRP